jgi:hypothetical protein
MPILLALVGLLALAAQPAQAQYTTRCSDTYYGAVECRDSDGRTLRIQDNGYGSVESTYTDPYGRRVVCRSSSDGLGGVTRTCY